MKRSAPGASRRLLASVVCAGLLALLGGCGGSGGAGASRAGTSASGESPAGKHSTEPSTSAHHAIGLAEWGAKTQALCRQKQAAIASLGAVHITYGGIARLGLPAVKRLLTRYLGRLLVVLRSFASRQQQLSTPPLRVMIMRQVRALDSQVQGATVHLRTELASVTSAAGLSAAFRTWLASLQRLGARGEALAQQLKLPACESARTAAQNISS